jgi:hypothetical protein
LTERVCVTAYTTQGLHMALQQHSWSAMCASAAAYLNDTVRQRTLALLGRAYSTLRLTDAAVFLGLSEAETSGGASLAVCSSPLSSRQMSASLFHRPGSGFWRNRFSPRRLIVLPFHLPVASITLGS